jgi:NAD(P)-dependent dehydrogenase (short-subunit alcohol dehydrogenase family)
MGDGGEWEDDAVTRPLGGRVILVAGAGSGIGRAAAIRLGRDGARLALVGRTAEKLVETAQSLAADSDAECYPLDIGDPGAVDDLARAVTARFGAIDAVVNTAGVNVVRRSLAECSVEDFTRVMQANLQGAFLLSRAFLPAMRAKGGTIIHVSSDSGLLGNNFAGVAYVASKFGVHGLVQAINAEERQHGIRATTIFPGEVDTPILDLRPTPPTAEARRRMLQPEDVAECIALAVTLPPRAIVEHLTVRPAAQDWISRR